MGKTNPWVFAGSSLQRSSRFWVGAWHNLRHYVWILVSAREQRIWTEGSRRIKQNFCSN